MRYRRERGVFQQTTNRRAFCDRVIVSIGGSKKAGLGPAFQQCSNRPIGGVGRNYAWKIEGVLRASGNSCDVVYGPMRLRGVLPPMIMTVRSDGSPITADSIAEAIDSIAEKGWRAKISHVELTFDLRAVPIEFFRRSIFSSAYKFVELRDQEGRRTYYIGGRSSPWQVCVYQKTSKVVRLEFKLRRPFLRSYGIHAIEHLKKLRELDLHRWLRMMELNTEELKSVAERISRTESEDVRQRILVSWFRNFRLREAVQLSKKHFDANPRLLVRPSKLDARMLKMQTGLIL